MKNLFIKISILVLLTFNSSATFEFLANQDKLEHFSSLGVPKKPLLELFEFYESQINVLYNREYISLIDYSMNSREKRFFIMNLVTGELQTEYVAHGSGRNRFGFPVADIGNNGKLDRCTHSKLSTKLGFTPHRRYGMTRPGFIRVDGTYHSEKFAYGEYKKTKAPNALLLTGLSETSEDVRRNFVVIHEAWYVKDKAVRQGRTLGCPGVAQGRIASFIDKLKGGSLLYSYVPQCSK